MSFAAVHRQSADLPSGRALRQPCVSGWEGQSPEFGSSASAVAGPHDKPWGLQKFAVSAWSRSFLPHTHRSGPTSTLIAAESHSLAHLVALRWDITLSHYQNQNASLQMFTLCSQRFQINRKRWGPIHCIIIRYATTAVAHTRWWGQCTLERASGLNPHSIRHEWPTSTIPAFGG